MSDIRRTVGRISRLVHGRSSRIKSIQRGTISTTSSTATATVTGVDTARSNLEHHGQTNDRTSDAVHQWLYHVDLQNSTTVRARDALTTNNNAVIGYELIERYA